MSSGFNGSGCTCVSASTFLPNHSGYFSAASMAWASLSFTWPLKYSSASKNAEWDSVAANKTYGTDRLNAYAIMEYTLNLKTVEVRDRQEYTDPDTGEEKVRYVLNRRETLLAREKQAQIMSVP